jgi:hypothetical protein
MRSVRVSAALSFLLLLAALAAAEPARAGSGLIVGVADDHIKWTPEPGPVLAAVSALRLDAIRVTLDWRPGRRHLTGRDHIALRRATAADPHGVRVVLAVYGRAVDAPRGRRAREDYCRFVRSALVRYGEITDVVVWNEANSDTFWRPHEDAPAAYAALLARCWDLLHAAVPEVNVVTTTAGSHDPAGFIRGIGAAYRASGRTRPLFDAAGHNPYPRYPDEPPTARHSVYIGQGDYERLVAVLDETFGGTAQPAAPIWYLENGFQTAVGRARRPYYAGRESAVRTVSPVGQAEQLAAALRLASCQPRVAAFFNFLLVDERWLGGWQSGLLWADWKRKPAFGAYRAAIDELRRGGVDCVAALLGPGERRNSARLRARRRGMQSAWESELRSSSSLPVRSWPLQSTPRSAASKFRRSAGSCWRSASSAYCSR